MVCYSFLSFLRRCGREGRVGVAVWYRVPLPTRGVRPSRLLPPPRRTEKPLHLSPSVVVRCLFRGRTLILCVLRFKTETVGPSRDRRLFRARRDPKSKKHPFTSTGAGGGVHVTHVPVVDRSRVLSHRGSRCRGRSRALSLSRVSLLVPFFLFSRCPALVTCPYPQTVRYSHTSGPVRVSFLSQRSVIRRLSSRTPGLRSQCTDRPR